MPARSLRRPLVFTLFALAAAGCFAGGGASHSDRLVLTRDKALVVLSLDTGEERPLVQPPADTTLIDPAVSPDGTRIAYTALLTPIVIPGQNTDLGSDIYVANAEGGDPALVVQHAVRSEQVLSPVWLPDGNGLIFSVQRFESQRIVATIERIDLATGERAVLVEDAYQPAVSRNGARVAFVRTEADYTQSVWVANADGSGEQRLAGAAQQLVSFQSPRFSPDGRYLYTGAAGRGELIERERARGLVLRRGAGEAARARLDLLNGLPEDIWRIDLATGELERVVELKIDSPSLSWAPDGRRLFVFGDIGLYAIDPEQHSSSRLAEGAYHGQVAWLSEE